eukprot:GHVT01091036.1.p1 GENE.GHVT01091036.1~~GHVT01091036.1.p1  ORF type:complete len:700 (-),score=90.89 GHVT01091036.1:1123-3222(-)
MLTRGFMLQTDDLQRCWSQSTFRPFSNTRKLLHATAARAPVTVIPTAFAKENYTGLFSEESLPAVVSISKVTRFSGAVSNHIGVGLKVFRNSAVSADLLFTTGSGGLPLPGTLTDWNVFADMLCNHYDFISSLGLYLMSRKHGPLSLGEQLARAPTAAVSPFYTSFPGTLGVSHYAGKTFAGVDVEVPRFPFALCLIAPPEIRQFIQSTLGPLGADGQHLDPFDHPIEQLKYVPVNSRIYELWAVHSPEALTKPADTMMFANKVADVLLEDVPFSTSMWADSRLSASHCFFESDLLFYPEWKKFLTVENLLADGQYGPMREIYPPPELPKKDPNSESEVERKVDAFLGPRYYNTFEHIGRLIVDTVSTPEGFHTFIKDYGFGSEDLASQVIGGMHPPAWVSARISGRRLGAGPKVSKGNDDKSFVSLLREGADLVHSSSAAVAPKLMEATSGVGGSGLNLVNEMKSFFDKFTDDQDQLRASIGNIRAFTPELSFQHAHPSTSSGVGENQKQQDTDNADDNFLTDSADKLSALRALPGVSGAAAIYADSALAKSLPMQFAKMMTMFSESNQSQMNGHVISFPSDSAREAFLSLPIVRTFLSAALREHEAIYGKNFQLHNLPKSLLFDPLKQQQANSADATETLSSLGRAEANQADTSMVNSVKDVLHSIVSPMLRRLGQMNAETFAEQIYAEIPNDDDHE